jgi:hypothetical protein
MNTSPENITADMIRKALEAAYQPPEWYMGFEVGNSTAANIRRHADAVAINAYPSQGYAIRGFEIKVSKQDLAEELKQGGKSDSVAQYCDYWFLVTPKGLTDGFTLPPTWGVLEYDKGKLRQKHKATKIENVAPTRGFLCAMLRGRERTLVAQAKNVSAEREEQIRREAVYGMQNATRELAELRAKLKEIHDATGILLTDWTPTQDIIQKLNAAKNIKIIAHGLQSLKRVSGYLDKDITDIREAIDEILQEGENQ